MRLTGNKYLKLIAALTILLIGQSCARSLDDEFYFDNYGSTAGNPGNRTENQETRNVMILYSAGFNNLSGYLLSNIADLENGWLPGPGRTENVLLVYSHSLAPGGNYDTPNPPVLYRLSKNYKDEIIRDTLVVYEPDANSVDPAQMNNVLTFIKDKFPARSYGMVFSSHSTGYLPENFYSYPDSYRFPGESAQALSTGEFKKPRAYEYRERTEDPFSHLVKSLGQQRKGSLSYEMDLKDFADAVPMYMDYMLFDACLMGGIECAYELRDKCRLVGFSPSEVLAEGFDYKTISERLIGSDIPDVESVCRDYYNRYDSQSGAFRSATISVVDCSRLEPLAEICREIFEKYRIGLANIKASDVQQYFRYDYHWFYDLEDIVIKAGADESDLAILKEALDECIVYKAATSSFLEDSGGFKIEHYSGLSMYLPADGNTELSKYYKTLDWNKATGWVK